MAHLPPRRIAALRRFRSRCWMAVALCLLFQTGAAAAQHWTAPDDPAPTRFHLEFLS